MLQVFRITPQLRTAHVMSVYLACDLQVIHGVECFTRQMLYEARD